VGDGFRRFGEDGQSKPQDQQDFVPNKILRSHRARNPAQQKMHARTADNQIPLIALSMQENCSCMPLL
jgi:hypothetical protein